MHSRTPLLLALALSAGCLSTLGGRGAPVESAEAPERFDDVVVSEAPADTRSRSTAEEAKRGERPPEPVPASEPVAAAIPAEAEADGYAGLGTIGSGVGGGGAEGAGGSAVVGSFSASGRGGAVLEGRGLGSARMDAPARVSHTPLRAGSTDDNADVDAFLAFLGTWTDRRDFAGRWAPMDVREGTAVRVVDAGGVPANGVSVRLERGGRTVSQGQTYGDGEVHVFPYLNHAEAEGELSVVVGEGPQATRLPWTGEDLAITLDSAQPALAAVPVDVAVVLDTTGSMADELDRIKGTLLKVTERLQELGRPVDLRLGGVLYRDRGDAYVTQPLPFTAEASSFAASVRAASAGGGGDGPESLNAALHSAVHDLSWRPGAARVAFLIADAPPHMDYAQDIPYSTSAQAALAGGIRVHTVAASGLDDVGSLVFRQVAQLTRGKFIFIEYGSMEVSAADHGVDGRQLPSNNLDDILYEQIRAEVQGFRS